MVGVEMKVTDLCCTSAPLQRVWLLCEWSRQLLQSTKVSFHFWVHWTSTWWAQSGWNTGSSLNYQHSLHCILNLGLRFSIISQSHTSVSILPIYISNKWWEFAQVCHTNEKTRMIKKIIPLLIMRICGHANLCLFEGREDLNGYKRKCDRGD